MVIFVILVMHYILLVYIRGKIPLIWLLDDPRSRIIARNNKMHMFDTSSLFEVLNLFIKICGMS